MPARLRLPSRPRSLSRPTPRTLARWGRLSPLLIVLATSPAHGHALPRCAPEYREAAHLFLDVPCAARPAKPRACTADAGHTRHRRGTEPPLTVCARRLAWVLALFGQLIRPAWDTPGYAWEARQFDRLVHRASEGDVPYDNLPAEDRLAFIEAVRGTFPSGDGPVPHVSVTPASDPRMRQPLSTVAALGLEAAADRYLAPALAAGAPPPYGPPPVIRIDVASPASIGVHGWNLREPWSAAGPPLHWRATPIGHRWQPDPVPGFTQLIIDTRGATMTQPPSPDGSLRAVVETLDEWRLAPFMDYLDGSLPLDIRRLAATARREIISVREAARAPWGSASMRQVFVVVMLAGVVQAVLHGSVGRFAPTVAEIHAIAVPARNIFPQLPLTTGNHGPDAVRGAAAQAIDGFVRHVRGDGATMLLYIGQDLPAPGTSSAAAAAEPPAPPPGEL